MRLGFLLTSKSGDPAATTAAGAVPDFGFHSLSVPLVPGIRQGLFWTAAGLARCRRKAAVGAVDVASEVLLDRAPHTRLALSAAAPPRR